MTAIAYRDGTMAADSACWRGNIISGHVQKIHRTADGTLLGMSGEYGYCVWWKDWFELCGVDAPPREPGPDGFAALIVSRDGKVRHFCGGFFYEIAAPFFAIGCVTDFLLGALHAGADAEEAIRLAIAHTDGAAGHVCWGKIGAGGYTCLTD